MAADVRIGTSGWNYPSGKGTWNGVFYPPSRGRAKNFDELSYYAEHFNTVEVNSTFYGQPRADITRRWAERTPAGFEFSVKLYQKFTHPKMFEQRIAGSLPADAHTDAPALHALSQANLADFDEFRRGIEPLASSGKLGALLADLGIHARAAELMRANPAEAEAVMDARDRLIGAEEMGTLFKAAAWVHAEWPEPAGFPS